MSYKKIKAKQKQERTGRIKNYFDVWYFISNFQPILSFFFEGY